ncbi:Protein CBG10455 [Caenorhabditis briggsae]|uniref:Protein CBG10455 n=1 Tax=Caenorhabditis briggsae TaxID=6238 RepID=A8XB94_CAEBR|nr:Protein CBG10455 [Caenorhabditis briggsae]CAP29874.2 Protein CBG10455 [Caenorhabditis briggsae]
MGLFMTVERTDDVSYGDMVKNYEAEPFYYSLRLFSESEELLDEVNLKKRWHHPLVAEIEVKQGGIWGVIYKPPGPGPFPCIIDTPVVDGRLCKTHAPLSASEGFLSFCFPMLDEPRLPKTLEDVDIEYLSKHIKYVQSLPYCSDNIGLYGISFAGLIAHHLATKHPELKVVATTNGPGAVLSSIDDWLVDGVTNGAYIRDSLLKTEHKVEIEFVNSGHVTVIPYNPHHNFGFNKFVNVNLGFGGETSTHGKV